MTVVAQILHCHYYIIVISYPTNATLQTTVIYCMSKYIKYVKICYTVDKVLSMNLNSNVYLLLPIKIENLANLIKRE